MTMSKPLGLSSDQAAAVRSALTALRFEQALVHIDFDPVDVYETEDGWIRVRGGPSGFEEYENLRAFESAYDLQDSEPELVRLAVDMEFMCHTYLDHAIEEGDTFQAAKWFDWRQRCRTAIAASVARTSRPGTTDSHTR